MLRIGAIAAGLSASAALAGCADLSRATAALGPAPANVESPVASAVAAAQANPPGFPRFQDVPAVIAVRDRTTPFQMSRQVQTLNRSGGDLTGWVQENPSLAPTATETFNQAALKALSFDEKDIPPADQAAKSEAYANSLRDKAAPPPPPK